MGFEFLDHTADMKIKATGKTIEEAFESAAKATVNFLTEDKIARKKEHEVKIKSRKLESLLYDFLEELIFLTDTKGFLFAGAKKLKIKKAAKGGFDLSCIAQGDSYKNYTVKGDIKAVTYNDMKITQKKSGFEIIVVMDI